MRAIKVKPKDWLLDEHYPIRILYESDEENYSIIFGKYKNRKAVGGRWNGETNKI